MLAIFLKRQSSKVVSSEERYPDLVSKCGVLSSQTKDFRNDLPLPPPPSSRFTILTEMQFRWTNSVHTHTHTHKHKHTLATLWDAPLFYLLLDYSHKVALCQSTYTHNIHVYAHTTHRRKRTDIHPYTYFWQILYSNTVIFIIRRMRETVGKWNEFDFQCCIIMKLVIYMYIFQGVIIIHVHALTL